MTDRPILFSAPMVRAILAGRKTQTRRIVKWGSAHMHGCSPMCCGADGYDTVTDRTIIRVAWTPKTLAMLVNPYGQPGDRLWVRETWAVRGLAWGMKPSQAAKIASPDAWRYAADDTTGWQHGWKPSIHMPRWASRITLEITGVRVERLQEISRGDAMNEGCPHSNMQSGPNPVDWYAGLWDEINGPGSWAANPWVWVVEFKRVMP